MLPDPDVAAPRFSRPKTALFLATATSMLLLKTHRPPLPLDTARFLNEARKAEIFHTLTRSPLPPDVLAQRHDAVPTEYDLVLHKKGDEITGHHLHNALWQTRRSDNPDFEPWLFFTLYGTQYTAPLRVLAEMDSVAQDFCHQLDPSLQVLLVIADNGPAGELSIIIDKTAAHAVITVAAGSLAYYTKEGLIAGLGHEAGHILGQPVRSPEDAYANEFRCDSMAAEFTSPKAVIRFLHSAALAYQDETYYMPYDSAALHWDNVHTFGFGHSQSNTHPGMGRRVQYMEMFGAFKQGRLRELKPPPTQSFTPAAP